MIPFSKQNPGEARSAPPDGVEFAAKGLIGPAGAASPESPLRDVERHMGASKKPRKSPCAVRWQKSHKPVMGNRPVGGFGQPGPWPRRQRLAVVGSWVVFSFA
jgi:hypothetical protein